MLCNLSLTERNAMSTSASLFAPPTSHALPSEPVLPTPGELRAQFPLTPSATATVERGRKQVRDVLRGDDDRILAVVGPCSIHNREAALEYASRLYALQEKVADRLVLIMRVYLEKPRTTVGWRGLLNDPYLDGTCDMAGGLRHSRSLLLQIAEMGMPSATEVLDIAAPLYLSDLLTCAGIGARTTESQPHRALASGLPCPVGFKNGTDGGLQIALDALLSAHSAHSYIGMDDAGRCRVIHTAGNPDTCLVLRGGKNTAGYVGNYDRGSLERAEAEMQKRGFRPNLVVDCSHANSGYNPEKQAEVCETVAQARKEGRRSLVSIMLESNLTGGKQTLPAVLSPGVAQTLRPDISVTDACLGWEETERILLKLSQTV